MIKKKITLDEVADAVYQLREDGEKVSERNILPITGGSLSTIKKMLTRFLDEEAQQEQFNTIGKNLTLALIAEINTVVDKETKSIRQKIGSARAQRDDTIKILQEIEKQQEKDVKQWTRLNAGQQEEIQRLKDALAHTKGERDNQQRELDTYRQENVDLRARATRLAEEVAYFKGRADRQ